jgi:signal peptidase II
MLALIIISIVTVLDQVSKYYAKEYLRPIGYFPIIQDVFHLTYVENRGAAFGMFQGQRWIFIVLTVAIAAAIAYSLVKIPGKSIFLKTALSLVLGGAIGNLIDRIRFGYVVDMFDFTLINYPVFNIADSSLVIGSILLGYYLLFIGDLDFKKVSGS